MDKWEGLVAVVTGASSGIGRAIALKLAEQGMQVAALARRQDRLQQMSEQFKGKGSIRGFKCDVSVESDIVNTFMKINKDMGPVRVLVNNAGVALNTDLLGKVTTDGAFQLFPGCYPDSINHPLPENNVWSHMYKHMLKQLAEREVDVNSNTNS